MPPRLKKQLMMTIPPSYFKEYRQSIGFSSQTAAKSYLAGKDLSAEVDYSYIDVLNLRIQEILVRINEVVDCSLKRDDMDGFCEKNIFHPYQIILKEGLLPQLNNQGRRPEDVLFSWLRGYAICEYFIPAFSGIFSVSLESISQIGDDDLKNVETFKRTPKADLEFHLAGTRLRMEVQSGFTGINDIKEHKVREARRVFEEKGIKTICTHIDLFNGQVAFVELDQIAENDANFVTRQQMEGQSVLSIDPNYFKWSLLDTLPQLEELELEI